MAEENQMKKLSESKDEIDIQFALPEAMKRILDVKETFDIQTDMDYFYLLKAIVSSKRAIEEYSNYLSNCRMGPSLSSQETFEFSRKYIKELSKYPFEFEALRTRLIQNNKFVPIFEKLMQEMEATTVERALFEYQYFADSSSGGGYMFNKDETGVLGVSRIVGCTVEETMEFASPNSKWVKEKLLSHSVTGPNDVMPSLTFGCHEIIMGLPLNNKQYLTVESDEIRKFAIKKEESKSSFGDVAEEDLPSSINLVRKTSLADATVDLSEFSDVQSLFNILKRDEIPPIPPPQGASSDTMAMGPNMVAPPQPDKVLQLQAPISKMNDEEEEEVDLVPYKNDLAYIQEQIDLSNCLVGIANNMQVLETTSNDDDDDDEGSPNDMMAFQYNRMMNPGGGGRSHKMTMKQSSETKLKKLRVKERVLRNKITEKLSLTKAQGGWYPRLERLVDVLKLSSFEKHIIVSLIRTVIAPEVRNQMNPQMAGRKLILSVGSLLSSFCSNLEERITFRKYFYKDSRLVRDGILNMVGQDFMVDLSECAVEIDRRMLDFCLGLDTEISEVVDGSHLYAPNVDFDDIILPEETKNLVLEAVGNYDRVKQVVKDLEIDKKITYGRGLVLLFHGLSGTGKTMLANGVATKLKRKILLINFPTLGGNSAGQVIKLIFREAKIHNAIIFFDECESLFQSREKGSSNVNMLLTELERHEGLSILATNRASDLDEAMYRRISLAIEFRKPDHILREKIWKTLQPPKLQMHQDVDLMQLALKYELTGGFIKNSWLSAVSFAVARDAENPVICHDDLMKAASHQLRGRLAMVDFDRRIIPTNGLDKVILPSEVKSSLQDIVNFGKAQSILFGQWGFSSQHGGSKGVGVLFHGHPGTGKTMAAEAIGYDLGRPLKVVNCAMLLSKWVGESAKNIQSVFDEAKAVDAVLVFDEAESLFGSRASDSGDGAGRHDTGNVGILLHHIETFPGVVIVITNLKDRIDTAFFRRFKFVLDFPKPTSTERLSMWKQLIPPQAPVHKGVDLNKLAHNFDFCGGNIKSVVFRAASRAALRGSKEDRLIRMEDLVQSCEEEAGKTSDGASAATMSMYN